MNDDSRAESAGTIPALVYVVLGLMALALVAEATVEPYPSITMPGFHQTGAVSNTADVGIRHLRIEYPDQTVTLPAAELFPSAPANQRSRMIKRLDQLSGSDEEWSWIDAVGRQQQQAARADAVELVLISSSGKELALVRLERV